MPVGLHAVQREQPLLVQRRREPEQSRVLVGLVAEIRELAAARDLRADARGQMIERRVGAHAPHRRAVGREPLAQDLAARVEREQRHDRRAVHIGERFTQCDERGVEIRGRTERVRERSEGTWGHLVS